MQERREISSHGTEVCHQGRKNCSQEKAIEDVIAALHLSSSSSGVIPVKEKTVAIPPKKIQKKTTSRAQSVALSMAIVRSSGFVVMVWHVVYKCKEKSTKGSLF